MASSQASVLDGLCHLVKADFLPTCTLSICFWMRCLMSGQITRGLEKGRRDFKNL